MERGIINIRVFYTWSQSVSGNITDDGFGITFSWDIPLLEGYDYVFVPNQATDPGIHHFTGIKNMTLISEIEDWKPDAILVYGWNFSSHFRTMRFFKNKIPVYFRGDSTLLSESSGINLKKFLRRIVLRIVYQYVDKAFYVGTANCDYFRKHGFKDSQLVYAPHAIDNTRFENLSQESIKMVMDWKCRLGICVEDIVILFSGKLEANKKPDLLLDTFLKLDHPGLHLIFAGTGPLAPNLIQKSDGHKYIHFLGFQNQSQMPLVYHLADICILPSGGPETWGLAINEAMASGKAVIMSDACGGSADLIRKGENGYVFARNNRTELLQLIHAMIHQGKRGLEQMGKRSRDIIQKFDYEIIAASLEQEIAG